MQISYKIYYAPNSILTHRYCYYYNIMILLLLIFYFIFLILISIFNCLLNLLDNYLIFCKFDWIFMINLFTIYHIVAMDSLYYFISHAIYKSVCFLDSLYSENVKIQSLLFYIFIILSLFLYHFNLLFIYILFIEMDYCNVMLGLFEWLIYFFGCLFHGFDHYDFDGYFYLNLMAYLVSF